MLIMVGGNNYGATGVADLLNDGQGFQSKKKDVFEVIKTGLPDFLFTDGRVIAVKMVDMIFTKSKVRADNSFNF